jgi:N-acetyl-anhydromuramyl-L-alanine amidase AmpD
MLDKNKKLINEDGFYEGSELKWGMEDVRNVLERYGIATTTSKEDVERILIRAFQNNYRLMEVIDETINETVADMIYEGQLKTDEQ